MKIFATRRDKEEDALRVKDKEARDAAPAQAPDAPAQEPAAAAKKQQETATAELEFADYDMEALF